MTELYTIDGLHAVGKSTVANRLADELDAICLSSTLTAFDTDFSRLTDDLVHEYLEAVQALSDTVQHDIDEEETVVIDMYLPTALAYGRSVAGVNDVTLETGIEESWNITYNGIDYTIREPTLPFYLADRKGLRHRWSGEYMEREQRIHGQALSELTDIIAPLGLIPIEVEYDVADTIESVEDWIG